MFSNQILDPLLNEIKERIRTYQRDNYYNLIWRLMANSRFSIRSFYRFLIDGNLWCRTTPTILKSFCPQKLNVFKWLAQGNKIITLDNLAGRGCNKLPAITYTLCHIVIKTLDHLFIHYPIMVDTWHQSTKALGTNRHRTPWLTFGMAATEDSDLPKGRLGLY